MSVSRTFAVLTLLFVGCSSSSPGAGTQAPPACTFQGSTVLAIHTDASACPTTLTVVASVRADGTATANGQACTANCAEGNQVANLACAGGDLVLFNVWIAGPYNGSANATTKAGCYYQVP